MNKKGWIRIVEAFVAVLLIAGVVLVVIEDSGQKERNDLSSRIHDSELAILREIQLNDSLRDEILNTSSFISWENFNSQAPKTRLKIQNRIPNYLECSANICDLEDGCFSQIEKEKDIYAEFIIISSTLQNYNPRLLKIFCSVR